MLRDWRPATVRGQPRQEGAWHRSSYALLLLVGGAIPFRDPRKVRIVVVVVEESWPPQGAIGGGGIGIVASQPCQAVESSLGQHARVLDIEIACDAGRLGAGSRD